MEIKKSPVNVDFFEDLTGDIETEIRPDVEAIGKRLQRLREEKGLTIEALSNLTGFEVDLLTKIETNQVNPQLGTMIKLSKALDSALGRLVAGAGDKLYSITRKTEQRTISRSTTQTGRRKAYTYKSLAPEVKGRHMEAFIVKLEENPEKEMSIHEGEEFIYVLDGPVTFRIGQERFDLDPGDSVYYLSTTPHMVAAKSGTATVLAVLYEG